MAYHNFVTSRGKHQLRYKSIPQMSLLIVFFRGKKFVEKTQIFQIENISLQIFLEGLMINN